MFLECFFKNIIVSIGCELLFSIRTNQIEAQIRFVELATTLAGKKGYIRINTKI